MLRPYPSEEMIVEPVNPKVNKASYDAPDQRFGILANRLTFETRPKRGLQSNFSYFDFVLGKAPPSRSQNFA